MLPGPPGHHGGDHRAAGGGGRRRRRSRVRARRRGRCVTGRPHRAGHRGRRARRAVLRRQRRGVAHPAQPQVRRRRRRRARAGPGPAGLDEPIGDDRAPRGAGVSRQAHRRPAQQPDAGLRGLGPAGDAGVVRGAGRLGRGACADPSAADGARALRSATDRAGRPGRRPLHAGRGPQQHLAPAGEQAAHPRHQPRTAQGVARRGKRSGRRPAGSRAVARHDRVRDARARQGGGPHRYRLGDLRGRRRARPLVDHHPRRHRQRDGRRRRGRHRARRQPAGPDHGRAQLPSPRRRSGSCHRPLPVVGGADEPAARSRTTRCRRSGPDSGWIGSRSGIRAPQERRSTRSNWTSRPAASWAWSASTGPARARWPRC